MCTNKQKLLSKLNSLVNRYGGDEVFTEHMSEWPRTIKELIYNSTELMIRFRLVELIPDPLDDEEIFIGME